MKKNLICAVVVTFNRKELLIECIDALLNQTRPLDHIYIIDNASTDGTVEFLKSKGYIDYANISLLSLAENSGGAGGFFEGIKLAVDHNFDAILLMDDDGYPEENCLARLEPYLDDEACVGSIVLDKANPNLLCFPIRLPKSTTVINETADLKKNNIEGVLQDMIIPFNGVLLHKSIVHKIGLPRKEYFIWGDDIEYIWRMRDSNISIGTVVDAHFFHPREAEIGTKMLFGRLRFNDTPSCLKLYCMSRNSTANLISYRGYFSLSFFIFKVLWFYLFTKLNKDKLIIAIKGIYHGIKRDFSHHAFYINKTFKKE